MLARAGVHKHKEFMVKDMSSRVMNTTSELTETKMDEMQEIGLEGGMVTRDIVVKHMEKWLNKHL